MDQTGIEPAASEVQAQHSTNELQARVLVSPTKMCSFDLIDLWLDFDRPRAVLRENERI